MADPTEFQRQAWFSPAFPVGGYAYSHGIEMAAADGSVTDAATLSGWIADILEFGAGRNDAILLGEAWRRAGLDDAPTRLAGLRELADLALALGLSTERRLESAQQGAAFHALIAAAWPHPELPSREEIAEEGLAYPVAVGIAGRLHGQPLEPLTSAYLQGFASNLFAAGIRLAIIGQSEAQVRLAALLPRIGAVARAAAAQGLGDLGGSAFRADLMSLRHETLGTRLFRS